MKITKTAKLKITSHTKIFDDTIDIYNKALSFYISVCEKEYEIMQQFKSSKEKLNYIEALTHITTKNKNIKYNFDKDFYKFPSYLRRTAIMEALGVCDSHFSRLYNWQLKKDNKLSNGKKFFEKPPVLNYKPKSFPTLYKSNMWEKLSDGKAKIKVYKNNDWVWIDIDYSTKNLKSGQIYRFSDYKEYNPMLVKKNKKYFLHIAYQSNVKLKSTPLKKQRVCSVDLGLTESAVCSIVDYNGTVLDRLFINQSKEKDQLKHKVNKLSKAKRISGILNEKPNYWRKINGLQKFIVQDTVDKIVKFAIKNNADVIIFEYLGKMKLPKGLFGSKRLRAKLQYWAKMKIQHLVEQKAHSVGIRYSRVLAKGTSMYAYDGSGKLKRSKRKDIATLQSKNKNNKYKTYHCDLSASYNIASRYFIRAILKPLTETKRLQVEAKVPLLADRASHTLSSLIKLREVC
jgi:IS605 OrfB family transposase